LSSPQYDSHPTLDAVFKPESIAVVGASRTPGKIGHEILRNLKLSGYAGTVYPINPQAGHILGLKCFARIEDVRGQKVDLAVIALPAQLVQQTLESCGRVGVRAVIIITSGFSEVGKAEEEAKLVEIARTYKMRIIGPNTFGIFYAPSKLNCTFGPNYVLSGKTAFITQSGALGLALMSWTTEEKYGVSSIVSIGNKSDVDDADLIEYFAQDEDTKSILIYMEGLKDGKRFYEASKEAVKKKPIIVIKSGRSQRGATAASSHTGSIAGQDRVYDAAFKGAGILRADTMTQAFDWLQAINENPIPQGENIMIITNGGGIGVLATDKCEQLGLKLMDVPEDLKAQLQETVPSYGSLRNPIDLTANADDETYRRALSLLMHREDVHGIIALFCQTATIDPSLVADAIATVDEGAKATRSKPLTAAFVGGHLSEVAYKRMLEKRFAAYPTTERCVDGMYALVARRRELLSAGLLSLQGH